MNKNSIQNLILIFLLLLVSLLVAYLIYNSYYNDNKNSIIQQKIKQLQETQKRIDQINQEIEKLKKFDEKEFAEKVVNLLNVNSHVSTSSDINVEGIEIIYKKNSKLVINHKEGYQIEVPKEFILNRTYTTDNIYFDDPARIGITAAWKWAVISILTAVNENNNPKSLFEFFLQQFEQAKNNPEVKTININGENFYRVPIRTDEGGNYYPNALFGYEYYLLKNNRIFIIFTENSKNYSAEDLDKFIRTFRLIKK